MESIEMRINERGSLVVEFDAESKFKIQTPPWPAIRVNGTRITAEFPADTEMHIAEVAVLTGYDPTTLRRLDGDGIPASTRQLADGSRAWKASDVFKIRERRLGTMGIAKKR